MRKFYRTTIVYEVLSEDPIDPNMDLRDIGYECEKGSFVGRFSELGASEVELTGAEMAEELIDFGSDPAFFNLDEDGNEVES